MRPEFHNAFDTFYAYGSLMLIIVIAWTQSWVLIKCWKCSVKSQTNLWSDPDPESPASKRHIPLVTSDTSAWFHSLESTTESYKIIKASVHVPGTSDLIYYNYTCNLKSRIQEHLTLMSVYSNQDAQKETKGERADATDDHMQYFRWLWAHFLRWKQITISDERGLQTY